MHAKSLNILDESAKIYLGIALIIVMVGMGLSLTTADFKRVFLYPKAVFIGLFNQIIILPLLAFALVSLLDIRPALAVGLMILAVCPGGPTSNLITHLCKGDTALSVTLTALSSIITLFTIPFFLEWNLAHLIKNSTPIVINRFDVFLNLSMVVLFPVIVGIAIKRYKPAFADRMDKPVKIASALILLFMIIGLSVKESDKIVPYFAEVGISTLALNVISLMVGFYTAYALGLSKAQSLTISIETGIQNGTLAIAIALGILKNSEFAIPAAVYSLIMFLTAFVLIGMTNIKRKNKAA